MKEIFFVTTNKHKVSEVKAILKPFNIKVTQIDMEYEENHDVSIEKIAKEASKKLADKLQKPVVVEDSGFFFEAYNNFPGALPRFVFNGIGYKGIMKLLKDEKRDTYAKAVVSYCQPGQNPIIFEGVMQGKIAQEVFDEDKDIMPYERIFIPEGYIVTMSKLTREEKNSISHRGKAFRKLAEYLTRKK